MFAQKGHRCRNNRCSVAAKGECLEQMMTLFGNREILKTLDIVSRTWLRKTLPPIAELCAPYIISVCQAFAPNFLPPVALLRDGLIATNIEEKCLPFQGQALHAKTVAQLIKSILGVILGVWRNLESDPSKYACAVKRLAPLYSPLLYNADGMYFLVRSLASPTLLSPRSLLSLFPPAASARTTRA